MKKLLLHTCWLELLPPVYQGWMVRYHMKKAYTLDSMSTMMLSIAKCLAMHSDCSDGRAVKRSLAGRRLQTMLLPQFRQIEDK